MKERDPFFDSLKFLLILFVVLGHVLEHNMNFSKFHIESSLFIFIYSFHMPLFIFISGYFSKNLTWTKYKNKLLPLILTYFVFQTILSIPSIINDTFSFSNFILYPQKVMWYIPALLFWRFSISIISKIRLSIATILLLSFAASFILGFKNIPVYLYIPSRFIVFLPYFIMGYYCSKEIISSIRNWKKLYSIIVLVLFAITIYIYMPYDLGLSFFAIFPYGAQFPGDKLLGLLYRFLSYFISIAISCAVINLATTKLKKWGDRTLDIYLLHAPLVYLIYYKIIDIYHLKTNLFFDLIAFFIITSTCLFLSKQKYIQYLINPITIFKKSKTSVKL